MQREFQWYPRYDEMKRLFSSHWLWVDACKLGYNCCYIGINAVSPVCRASVSLWNYCQTEGFIPRSVFGDFVAMLSSVPTRLIARRSRSLSPCARVLQTSANGAVWQGIRDTPTEANRNPVVSTSRVSRRGILVEETASTSVTPSVQYHHLAPRWLSNLENRRSSWAALASRGRKSNRYWEESSGGEDRETGGGASRAGVASAGVLSAAAVAFCLKKDSDNKGRPYQSSPCCLLCYYLLKFNFHFS